MAGRRITIPNTRAALLALGLLTAPFTPFPAHSQVPTQYTVSNDATGSYVAAWNWSVSKSVTPPSTQYVAPWTPAVFGFEVAVSHSPTPQAKQVRVTGNILVENFGNPAALLDLSDRLLAPLPATCSVIDAFGAPATGIIVPVFFFDFFTYQCDLPDGPAPAATGLNESTVRVHLFRAIRRLRSLLQPGAAQEQKKGGATAPHQGSGAARAARSKQRANR